MEMIGAFAEVIMNPKVRRIVDRMKSELHLKRSLDDWARLSSLSRSRMCHLFKMQMGVSPAHYLKALRLETARTLLETTSLSVKEVRARVGLQDQSHFVRDFNHAYGVPPSQYRARRSSLTSGSTIKQSDQKN
jgi:transcriptional regulator GlxA family with amidase domain